MAFHLSARLEAARSAAARMLYNTLKVIGRDTSVAWVTALRVLLIHSQPAVDFMLSVWERDRCSRLPGAPITEGLEFLRSLLQYGAGRAESAIAATASNLIFENVQRRIAFMQAIVRYAAGSSSARTAAVQFLRRAIDSHEFGVLASKHPPIQSIFLTLRSLCPVPQLAVLGGEVFSLTRFLAWEALDPWKAAMLLASILRTGNRVSDTVIGDGVARMVRDPRCIQAMSEAQDEFRMSFDRLRQISLRRNLRISAASVFIEAFPRWTQAAGFALEVIFEEFSADNASEQLEPTYQLVATGSVHIRAAAQELATEMMRPTEANHRRSIALLRGLLAGATLPYSRNHFEVVARLAIWGLPNTFIARNIAQVGPPPPAARRASWELLVYKLGLRVQLGDTTADSAATM